MGDMVKSIMGKETDAEKSMKAQAELAKKKEMALAKELAARRRAGGGSQAKSKTVFDAVQGIGSATAKKTKLGQ